MALGCRKLPTCPQLQEQYFYVTLTTAEKIEVIDDIGMREMKRKRQKLRTFYSELYPLTGCMNKIDTLKK